MSFGLSSSFSQFKIPMAVGSKNGIFQFDNFKLDAANLMLYRDDAEISLPPKVVKTLAVLVENGGEIISKDDLIDQVWTDTIVEEANLTQHLYLLRRTLGNRPDGQQYIETLRRRGYRFTGDARLVTSEAGSNGRAGVAAPLIAVRRYDVERRGNVLAVADWREPIPTLEAKPEIPQKDNYWRGIAVVALIVLAVAAVSLGLVWYRSGSTQAVAEQRAALTVERLTNGVNPHYATISPDGKYFAYSDHDGETWGLYVQQTGQSNPLELIGPSERSILEKTFSPDGQFIYFLAVDKGETRVSLYRIPTLGGVQTKILDDIQSPVSFSPDGKEMVFERFDQRTGESAFIIAASDGKTERTLQSRTREQERWVFPAWSPDGSTIAFVTIDPPAQGGQWGINAIDLKTGEIRSLSPQKWGNCFRIAWMPDGRGLVFIGTKVGEGLSTRRDNVFYLNIQTGEARCLTVDGNRYQLTGLGVTNDGAVIAVPESRLSQIWQMSPDGDARTAVQITHGLQDGRVGLAPLPDGRVGYIARTGEYLNVWLMNHDGTGQKQLTNDPSYMEELRASPDGSFFVFLVERDNRRELFRIDADGADLRALASGDELRAYSAISPDGNWIVHSSAYFEAGNYKHALWKIPSRGGAEAIRVGATDCLMPHFSPDGKFLSCVGGGKIYILSAETGEVVKTFQALQPALYTSGVKWTPDGKNLVYIVTRKKVANLWLQPLDGAPARQLTDFTTHGIWNFAFSTDGSRLYVVRVYQANDAVLIRNF